MVTNIDYGHRRYGHRRTQAEMLADRRAEIEALDMDEAWIRRCIAELEADPDLDADGRRDLTVLREVLAEKS
jgi:hypothetical protein